MMELIKKVLVIFLIIVISNLLIEFLFENKIENLVNLKFLLSTFIISIICGIILIKKSHNNLYS